MVWKSISELRRIRKVWTVEAQRIISGAFSSFLWPFIWSTTIRPFAVNKSFNLNEETFLFLNKVTKNYKNIIIIPDGPLNSMPLHALAYEKSNNCRLS